MSNSSRSGGGEWPELDLEERSVTRLALAWTVSYEPVAPLFEALLDDTGSFAGVLSYSAGDALHHRVEAAQTGTAEDGALLITVQYQPDSEAPLEIPEELQDGAHLLAPLRSVADRLPVLCHVDLAYENSPRLRTIPALPILPAGDDEASRFEQIYGVRGIKQGVAGGEVPGYTFALDRMPAGDIVLALDFLLEAPPVAEAPTRALDVATVIASVLVPDR